VWELPTIEEALEAKIPIGETCSATCPYYISEFVLCNLHEEHVWPGNPKRCWINDGPPEGFYERN